MGTSKAATPTTRTGLLTCLPTVMATMIRLAQMPASTAKTSRPAAWAGFHAACTAAALAACSGVWLWAMS
ncbi:hypothetical protein AMK32_30570 [Streptomyces sp. CB01883]|nr:hypothetical protein AMK32_30570 [Streptomyces sp. CB01883]